MHRKLIILSGIYMLALLPLVCVAGRVRGQECPSASTTGPSVASQGQTLEGRLVYHDGIRQWFELKLDKPHCGQNSIQLLQIQQKANAIEPLAVLGGCRIRSIGPIDLSPTGYYSLDTFQDVKKIDPIGTCARQPLFHDYSGLRPHKGVQAYRVDMHIIYGPEDNPIIFHVSSAGRALRPWQAYASYWLTGGFVLYGRCGKGFVIDTVFGTPQAHPGQFDDPRTPDDMAEFDPEGAAHSGKRDLHLGYTCIRDP